MNPKIIKEIGASSLLIGLIQMTLTFGAGFFVALLLGFGINACVYIGIALAFSSTIIITKLFSSASSNFSLFFSNIFLTSISVFASLTILFILTTERGFLNVSSGKPFLFSYNRLFLLQIFPYNLL